MLAGAPHAVAGAEVAGAEVAGAEVVGGPRLAARGVVVEPGTPAPPAVKAASWLVADLDSGEVLAARDAHGRFAPASTLKTLTALALIPELPRDRVVSATFDDVDVEGSRVGIVEDVDYPVHELFSSLLMVSGNDSANVLASAAGGQARTAELMNATARSLHALDTHAVNPHGLDAPGQASSAYDLALVARAGLAVPEFATYVRTISSSVSAPKGARIAIRNKNKLLARYPGALGVKNGYTTAARASFVGAAERDGRRLVVTLMRADPRVFDEAVKLLDWGFATEAAPVGVLVDPDADLPAARADGSTAALEQSSGGSSSASTAPAGSAAAAGGRRAPDEPGTGLPVTVAGMSLAAAALFAARARPAPASRSHARRASAGRSSARTGPSRRPARRPRRTTPVPRRR